MANEEHTSNRTSLGLVLQFFVEEALKGQKVSFLPNHAYYPTFIKPDLLIPSDKPKYSVHVTATGTDASFRMKKWRYIDEIFQMRSVWQNKFASINVLFGPVAGYQAGDRKLMAHLFDIEVITDDIEDGVYAYKGALKAVSSNKTLKAGQVVEKLKEDKRIVKFINALGVSLKKLVSSETITKQPQAICGELSSYLKQREQRVISNPPLVKTSFWKRSLLRLLAVRPEYCQIVFDLTKGEVPFASLPKSFISEAVRAKLIIVRDGIGGNRFVEAIPEVGVSVKDGLTIELLGQLRKSVYADPRRKFELEDLWDGGKRASEAVNEVRKAYLDGHGHLEQLIATSIQNGGSKRVPHHRAHVIDVLTSAIGLSQNLLNEQYRGPGLGITDPVRNMVPRTDLAVQAIKLGKVVPDLVAPFVLEPMLPALKQVPWSDTELLKERYLDLRAYNLTKGGSVDPLEDYVFAAMNDSGWIVEKPAITSKHPLVGSIKTVFTAVGSKGEKKLILKCLFGDSGADHKAEEMEARIRVVRLGMEKGVELHTVFVADGKWSKSNLRSLVIGGWDHVIGVAHLRQLLVEIG